MELYDGPQKVYKYSTFPGWRSSSHTSCVKLDHTRIRNEGNFSIRLAPSTPPSERQQSPTLSQNLQIQTKSSIQARKWDCVNTWQPKHYRQAFSSDADCFQEVGPWTGRYHYSLPPMRPNDGGMIRRTKFIWNIQKVPGSVHRFINEDPDENRVMRIPPPYPGEVRNRKEKNRILVGMRSRPDFGHPPNYTPPPPYRPQSGAATPDTPMRSRAGDPSYRFQTHHPTRRIPSQLQLLVTDQHSDGSHRDAEMIPRSCLEKPRRRSGGTVFCLVSCVEDPANISSSPAQERNQEQTQLKDWVTCGEYANPQRSIIDQLTTDENQNQTGRCSDVFRKEVRKKIEEEELRVQTDQNISEDEDPTETFTSWKKPKQNRPSKSALNTQGDQSSSEDQQCRESNLSEASIRGKNKTFIIIDATNVVVQVQRLNSGVIMDSGPGSDICTIQKISQINADDSPQGSNSSSDQQTGPTSEAAWCIKSIQRAEKIHKIRHDEPKPTGDPSVWTQMEKKLQIKANPQNRSKSKAEDVKVPSETDLKPPDDGVVTAASTNEDQPDITSPVRHLESLDHIHQGSDHLLKPHPNLSGSESSVSLIDLQNGNISNLQVSHLIKLFTRDHVQNTTKISGDEKPSNSSSGLRGDLLGTRKDEELVETCHVLDAPVENTTSELIPQNDNIWNKEEHAFPSYHLLPGEDLNTCGLIPYEMSVVNPRELIDEVKKKDTKEDEDSCPPFLSGSSKIVNLIEPSRCFQNRCSHLINKPVTVRPGQDGSTTEDLRELQDPCSDKTRDKNNLFFSPTPSSSHKYTRSQRCPHSLWEAVSRIRKHTAPDSEEEEEHVELWEPRTTEGGSGGGTFSQNVFMSLGVEEERDDARSNSSVESRDSVDTVIRGESEMMD